MKNLKICILPIMVMVFLVAFSNASAKNNKKVQNSKIVVYYFHVTQRCQTCLDIEKFTNEAMQRFFVNDMAVDKIEWKVINTDNAADEHFIKHYNLEAQALIISKEVNGKEIKWKNLEKIWDLTGNVQKFEEYVKNEVKSAEKWNNVQKKSK